MTRPPKPPIVHRLEQRRLRRTDGDDVGLMVWACVAVAVVLLGCIVVWGGR